MKTLKVASNIYTPLLFFISFLSLSPFSLRSQDSGLTNQLENLKKLVGEVDSEKKNYSQEFKFSPQHPYTVELITRETDKKGKTIEEKALFNLGLLDKNLVRRENTKDLMWISAKSEGNPVIKMYVDGVLSDYKNELKFYCEDINHARSIEEALKPAIILAEKEWKNSIQLPDKLKDLNNWLVSNTVNTEEADASFKQALSFDDNLNASLISEEYDAKGLKKAAQYSFALEDLNERSIAMKIRKKRISVEASTKQNFNYIRHEENGEMKGYVNSLSIYFDDVENAQLYILSLQKAIPLAKSESEKRVINTSSPEEGLKLLADYIKDFTVNEETYNQSLLDSYLTTYIQKVDSKKGVAETKFSFDFSDLNEQTISLKAVKQHVVVEANTREKKSLIEVNKDGEQQNYSQQIRFYLADLASAKQFMHTLKYVAGQAPKEIKPKDFEWLATTLSTFDENLLELKQSLEKRDGEECKISFTTRKESSKKVDEHIIEFNLSDIDAKNLSLLIKGKKVEVLLPTNFGETIIKDYENNGKISYKKSLSILAPNIQTGKEIMATLQKAVSDCSTK